MAPGLRVELDHVDLLEMPPEAMDVWNRAAAPHMHMGACVCGLEVVI